MPYLMVNLDDPADCRRAWEQLAEFIHPGPRGPGRRCGPPPQRTGSRHRGRGEPHRPPPPPPPPPPGGELAELPLGQKLQRIRQRGIWPYLQRVATQVDTPLSLPELDEQLGLAKNKMRSLKAILGKLERRWGLEFLVPDPQGSVDAAGNPRYIMPPGLRKRVIRLSE